MAHTITETCIGCTACTKVCPVEAISGENKEIHRIDPSICIDCGACTFVCPVECIHNPRGEAPERIKKRTDWPKPQIIDELCTGCNFCVEVCPFNCLQLDDRPFAGVARLVDPKSCVGCSMCEEVCAKNAIWVPDSRSLRVIDPRLASAIGRAAS